MLIATVLVKILLGTLVFTLLSYVLRKAFSLMDYLVNKLIDR